MAVGYTYNSTYNYLDVDSGRRRSLRSVLLRQSGVTVSDGPGLFLARLVRDMLYICISNNMQILVCNVTLLLHSYHIHIIAIAIAVRDLHSILNKYLGN